MTPNVGEKRLHPVPGGGQTDALGTVSEREHLGGVDPGTRSPGQAVHADKYVCQSDDGLGRGAVDGPLEDLVTWGRVSKPTSLLFGAEDE